MAKIGRWNRYQLLVNHADIKPYVLPTVLFSKDVLQLKEQKWFRVRPCFGIGDCWVIFKESPNEYKVMVDEEQIFVENELDFYQKVKERMERYHVLIMEELVYNQSEYTEVIVTTHKEGLLNWDVCNINLVNDNPSINISYEEIKNIAQCTSEVMGEHIPLCYTTVIKFIVTEEDIWLDDVIPHYTNSKWNQYHILRTVPQLNTHLPNTQIVTSLPECDWIKASQNLIIKPCYGQNGIGITKLTINHNTNTYQSHHELEVLSHSRLQNCVSHITNNYLEDKEYVIQQYISLATVEGSIFDTRVLLMRNSTSNRWEVLCKVARVAVKSYIVTNVARKVALLQEILPQSSVYHSSYDIENQIDRLSISVANRFGEYYRDSSRLGIDIAIDQQAKVWILEVNVVPDLSMYKKLENTSMYDDVISKLKEIK
ncbi:YheC/YheD family protein [Pontibacillus salicampi]|uniref:YheC/YheD family protein n=1 Tax=Pontibacillus salicampi TaxID=1449801 RepID=A0ABV6LI92_9BACI